MKKDRKDWDSGIGVAETTIAEEEASNKGAITGNDIFVDNTIGRR